MIGNWKYQYSTNMRLINYIGVHVVNQCTCGITYSRRKGDFWHWFNHPKHSRILESEIIETSHWFLTKRLHFQIKFSKSSFFV